MLVPCTYRLVKLAQLELNKSKPSVKPSISTLALLKSCRPNLAASMKRKQSRKREMETWGTMTNRTIFGQDQESSHKGFRKRRTRLHCLALGTSANRLEKI